MSRWKKMLQTNGAQRELGRFRMAITPQQGDGKSVAGPRIIAVDLQCFIECALGVRPTAATKVNEAELIVQSRQPVIRGLSSVQMSESLINISFFEIQHTHKKIQARRRRWDLRLARRRAAWL
jgi:hypothetical protein